MTENQSLATVAPEQQLDRRDFLTAVQVHDRMALIKDCLKTAMVKGIDYGLIPGCGDRPTLLKPGAEKVLVMFRLRPVIGPNDIIVKELGNGYREYTVYTHVLNSDGEEVATGVGSCSGHETKYRYRKGSRKCPACGKESIIAGKAEYGGGWLCFAKKGGCGAKFKPGDKTIEGQEVGMVENPDPADQWNTQLKMAVKRSGIAGAISATACSSLFNQDLDNIKGVMAGKYDDYLDAEVVGDYDPELDPEAAPAPANPPSPTAEDEAHAQMKANGLKLIVSECMKKGIGTDDLNEIMLKLGHASGTVPADLNKREALGDVLKAVQARVRPEPPTDLGEPPPPPDNTAYDKAERAKAKEAADKRKNVKLTEELIAKKGATNTDLEKIMADLNLPVTDLQDLTTDNLRAVYKALRDWTAPITKLSLSKDLEGMFKDFGIDAERQLSLCKQVNPDSDCIMDLSIEQMQEIQKIVREGGAK